MPPVTQWIVMINAGVYLLQMFIGDDVLLPFLALWPDYSTNPQDWAGGGVFLPWQLVSYAFLHGGLTHIFFNMLALYMFGPQLELTFGPRRYLSVYLWSVVAAALTQMAWTALSHSEPSPTIGASGGVFGLLLAYALYFPRNRIALLLPPVVLPAWLFVVLYGALELVLGATQTAAGVAHFAHLGGMLGAFLYLKLAPRRR